MSKSLNPKAKVFVPKTSSDVIYINRGKGKIETIILEDTARDDTYRANSLRVHKEHSPTNVYVKQFDGWTFNQIATFLRRSTKDACLDVLYEATRQSQHLDCIGMLMLLTVQKGETLENCEARVWQAFSHFYTSDYDAYCKLAQEIQWVRETLKA
jgi:hypothetical protein